VIVVLDTNVLHRDVWGQRPAFQALVDRAEHGQFEVVVPRVVVDELFRQFPDRLRELLKDTAVNLKKTAPELKAFGLPVPSQHEVDVDDAVARYPGALEDRLSGPGRRIADHPEAARTAKWAVNRRRPFKADGRGLPDALIWLTVLECAQEDDVVFVTSNTTDFADPDSPERLAPELRADLQEAGFAPERVRLVPTLSQFSHLYIEPVRELEERAQALLTDLYQSERLKSAIATAAAFYPVSLDAVEWGLIVDVDDASLETFDAQEIELLDTAPAGGEGLDLVLKVGGDARLGLFVEKGEAFALPEDSPVSIWDPDWNDWFVAAEAEVPAVLEVEARYLPADGGSFSVAIEAVQPWAEGGFE
jgi:predicted nucleic acid-binding protein